MDLPILDIWYKYNLYFIYLLAVLSLHCFVKIFLVALSVGY